MHLLVLSKEVTELHLNFQNLSIYSELKVYAPTINTEQIGYSEKFLNMYSRGRHSVFASPMNPSGQVQTGS